MLLDLAEALNPLLDKRAVALEAEGEEDTTLQLVFFDGEEAFHDWTATDSIYGSRFVLSSYLIILSALPLFRLSPSPLSLPNSPRKLIPSHFPLTKTDT